MSEVVDPKSENKRPTEYQLADPGYYVIQIETHDPRVSTLFTSKAAEPPKFGIHDVTPKREFSLLDTLKPKVREAFLLSQLDGLTYKQIGERLGVGERMVKKYMAQAMLCCLQADDGR